MDWELRRRLLAELERAHASEGPAAGARIALGQAAEGAPKLWTVRQALRVRCDRRAALAPGASYDPLAASGPASDHVVAFARGGEVVTVVPRLVLGLGRRGGWGETTLELPPGRWRDALTGAHAGGRSRVAELLGGFPVALLVRED